VGVPGGRVVVVAALEQPAVINTTPASKVIASIKYRIFFTFLS
jgi:hypothetical protein